MPGGARDGAGLAYHLGPMTHCPPPTDQAEAPAYSVAVRTLCEFTARSGDLDLRFSPTPTAREGQAGHAIVAARRPPGYLTEVALSGRWGPLQVRGRADGFDPALGQLEEVKTHRGDAGRITPAQRQLHWAQLKVYGALMCAQDGLPSLRLALVYYQLEQGRETVELQTWARADLQAFFEQQCAGFLAWAEQELAHRQARQSALAALAFPHASLRPGQRELAEATWRATTQGRHLMAQAPTGTGKTLGALFPALKAMAAPGRAPLDKLFFLTAKSSGRAVALQALSGLGQADAPQRLPLRVLELVARDKACEHPDRACHGESCPLAQGFFDKLPKARSAAVTLPAMDKAALRRLALDHGVCPYHLSHDLLRWADVVVGDCNYYFDPHALLYALTRAQEWRVAVLVDEAHNLIERARQMYSAELDEAQLLGARREAPPELRRDIDRVRRRLGELAQDRPAWSTLEALPRPLKLALEQLASRTAAWQAEHPADLRPALQRFFFDLLAFLEREEALGGHSFLDLSLPTRQAARRPLVRLSLRNVVPAPFLRPRLEAAQSSVLFSATLEPSDFYLDLLGLPERTVVVDVPSPFAAAQLQVVVHPRISTRWQDRAGSLPALVDVMAAQWAAEPGKYLAFFSSFDYLQQAADALAQAHPGLPQWRQMPRMDEAQQQAFLERFRSGAPGIGFAVLGGSFAEGIDLPGSQLIGAFIATLGLPQVNPVNEEIRARLQALFGARRGQDYAYLYPGVRKVAQAAGRVIRRSEDHGVVHLMDGRFAQPQVRALLPAWWRLAPQERSG